MYENGRTTTNVRDRNATAKGIHTHIYLCVSIGILFAFKTETYNFHGVGRPRKDIIIIIIITTSNCNEYIGNWIQSKGRYRSSPFDMRIRIYSRTREMRAIKRRCVRSYSSRTLLRKRERLSIGARICYVRGL